MRYVNVSSIMAYRLVSEKVSRRFPKLEDLEPKLLLLPSEVTRLNQAEKDHVGCESTWMPLLWAMKLLRRARKEKKIEVEAPIFSNLISSFEPIDQANRKVLNFYVPNRGGGYGVN